MYYQLNSIIAYETRHCERPGLLQAQNICHSGLYSYSRRVAYSIEVESKVRYDFIPIFELDEFIERLGVCHQIQIISQCDKWGNYVLPDVELLEFEKRN